MPQNTFEDELNTGPSKGFVLQTKSHYMSRCCLRYMSPYGVTEPQCVKTWKGTSDRENTQNGLAQSVNPMQWLGASTIGLLLLW